MIIPVRCFTCGSVLADKYDYYVRETKALEQKQEKEADKGKPLPKKKAAEEADLRHFTGVRTGPILDKLGLTRYCCRRSMLGTVDMMDAI